MDYPKSVASVGLVNGRFVDEDPVTGTPGSLIPASWGNSVTQEILEVIKSSGAAADEGDNTQLRSAINALIQKRQNESLATQEDADSVASLPSHWQKSFASNRDDNRGSKSRFSSGGQCWRQ
jgi:hypothetical protein